MVWYVIADRVIWGDDKLVAEYLYAHDSTYIGCSSYNSQTDSLDLRIQGETVTLIDTIPSKLFYNKISDVVLYCIRGIQDTVFFCQGIDYIVINGTAIKRPSRK